MKHDINMIKQTLVAFSIATVLTACGSTTPSNTTSSTTSSAGTTKPTTSAPVATSNNASATLPAAAPGKIADSNVEYAPTGHYSTAPAVPAGGGSVQAEAVSGDVFLAARDGNIEKVRRLIAQGANPNQANENGETPLHAAAVNNHQPIVLFLIQSGANINATTVKGWTPLHTAARFGAENALSTLMQNGADASGTTDSGQTPAMLARNMGHIRSAGLIQYYSR